MTRKEMVAVFREVLVPEMDQLRNEIRGEIRDEIGQLRNEMNAHFDDVYKRFDRLESEHYVVAAAVRRLEERPHSA